MKKNRLFLVCGLFFWGLITPCFSASTAVTIAGMKPGWVSISPAQGPSHFYLMAIPSIKKPIQLQKIILSPTAQAYLKQQANHPLITNLLFKMQQTVALAPQVENGMNNVPVLDQGEQGTCTTFATTAALDAAYNRGDYISQLCNLELGMYLHHRLPDYPSGWEGSTSEIIAEQIKRFGILNLNFQARYGCSGIKNYPLHTAYPKAEIPVRKFQRYSENIMAGLSYQILLNIQTQAFSPTTDMQTILEKVKTAIFHGHRVVIDFLLDEKIGGVGTQAKFKAPDDSWVLTSIIQKDIQEDKVDAGHALIITGYDDNAIITDNNNQPHIGVLTLRNSWGPEAGDKGNYYMSYDYFLILVMEALEIFPNKV